MIKALISVLLFTFSLALSAQVKNPEFESKVSSLINYTVPIMSVEDLQNYDEPLLILDAREEEEYNISHIPHAIYIGYDKPLLDKLNHIDKTQPILLYCSVGYRSEKLGEKLQEMGYVHVYNLFGSIFEWANQGYPLLNTEEKQVKTIHTYNKSWSKWVTNTAIEKVW